MNEPITGQPETYGPIRAITFTLKHVGHITEISAVVEYDRRTVILRERAAESAYRWYCVAKQHGDPVISAMGVTWTVHEERETAQA